jgi:hypothetical protein
VAGYLDQYGAGEDRRLRTIRILVISAVSAVVLGAVLLFVLHNFRQERQAKQFFQFLEQHNYQAAYDLWVRTDSDRKGYPMDAFLRDWGPQSPHPSVDGYRISRSRSCGTGVILTVDFPKGQPQEKLWVERNTLTIGFSPPNPCAIVKP